MYKYAGKVEVRTAKHVLYDLKSSDSNTDRETVY